MISLRALNFQETQSCLTHVGTEGTFPVAFSAGGKSHSINAEYQNKATRIPSRRIRPKDGKFRLFITCYTDLPELTLLTKGVKADCKIERKKLGDNTYLLNFDSQTELAKPLELQVGDESFPLLLPR